MFAHNFLRTTTLSNRRASGLPSDFLSPKHKDYLAIVAELIRQ